VVSVEHLLEVGDEPDRIDGVAREPPADLVVDAARGHAVESQLDDARPAAGEEEFQRRGGRELRRAAEASVALIGGLAEVRDGSVEDAGGEGL
jgi:hypothetical protein